MAMIYRADRPAFKPHKYKDGSYHVHAHGTDKAEVIRIFGYQDLLEESRAGGWHIRMSDGTGASPSDIAPENIHVEE